MAQAQNMVKYIIKRLLLMIPMVIVVLLASFLLTTVMSQTVDLSAFGGLATPEQIAMEKARIGFDDPWHVKFITYFSNFFRGDWGTSYLVASGMPVTTLLGRLFPKTLELVLIPMILIPILSVRIGVYSAKNMNNWRDTLVRVLMMIGVCVPVFWLVSLIQYFVSVPLYQFTRGGLDFRSFIMNPNSIEYGNYILTDRITGFRLLDGFLRNNQNLIQDTLLHLILPSLVLTVVSLAGIARQTRASMLEVMQKDYVRTARAKGVSDSEVINSHTLRNALIPASTAIIATIFGLVGGSLFIELTFNYTGMSYYMITAIRMGDYVVAVGGLVLSTSITLVSILIMDIAYTIIDPRIVYT